MRQAGHHRFDREGDTLLRLQRRIAWCGSIDLYLHIGNVRYRIYRQLPIAEYSDSGHGQGRQHNNPAMLNGKNE
jgi:hypothetical protein